METDERLTFHLTFHPELSRDLNSVYGGIWFEFGGVEFPEREWVEKSLRTVDLWAGVLKQAAQDGEGVLYFMEGHFSVEIVHCGDNARLRFLDKKDEEVMLVKVSWHEFVETLENELRRFSMELPADFEGGEELAGFLIEYLAELKGRW